LEKAMSKKYSIALCTYNGEKYISEQLDSLLNQTIMPTQIVICDDNSLDNTLEIADGFRKKHTNIKWQIIHNKTQLGVIKNFEQAIRLCTEDIVFLCDQDDVWCSNKSEIILKHFSVFNDDVVFSNAYLINESSVCLNTYLFDVVCFRKKQKKFFNRDFKTMYMFLEKNYATGATMAFRKHVVEKYMPFPIGGYFIHDYWIAVLSACTGHLGFIDYPTTYYRLHRSQLIGLPTEKKTNSVKYNKFDSLMSIIVSDLEKEITILQYFLNNPYMISTLKTSILQKRIFLFKKLHNNSKNIFSRISNITFSLYKYKIPEFCSIRSFIGNSYHYILKK
jgi:glycosyltransferase involved in cell wall biosynthesis